MNCTGVLVHARYVLSAAHCGVAVGDHMILGRSDGDSTSTGWKTTVAAWRTMNGGGWRYSSAAGRTYYHRDLVIVRLAAAAPSRYPPIPMATPGSPVKTLHWKAGQGIRSYGYGAHGYKDGKLQFDNKLRNAVFRVNTTDQFGVGQMTATWSGRQLCRGDSGGPVTKLVSGRRYLIAIHSTIWKRSDTTCDGSTGTNSIVVANRGAPTEYNWVRGCVWGTSCPYQQRGGTW